jgi:hypothetical protein
MKILVRCQIHSFNPIDDESESRKNSESEEEEEEEEEKEEKSNFEFTNVYAMNEYDKNVYLSKEGNLTGPLLKKDVLFF